MKSKAKLQIVAAAGITFSRFGFKKTTMDDIAFAAGKGKSSLYYYFKNKEEVFEAVVDYEAETLKSEINEALLKIDKPIDKLHTYISKRMHRFVAKGNLYTALNDNFLATLSFIEKIRNKHREWEINIIDSILKEGIERKEFKEGNIEFMGTTILTAMIGFEVPMLTSLDKELEFDKKIKEVINMLFYGICT